MASFQLCLPTRAYAIIFLMLQQFEIVVASPTLASRAETSISTGLSQPEKITLYVVAAVGAFFAILGVAFCILRPHHADNSHKHSRKVTQTILNTIPIVQFSHGSELCPSTRASSFDGTDDLGKEKIETQRNTTCPICTEDFIGNQMLRRLRCNHQYHMACIEDWLFRSSSCPVCRIVLESPMQAKEKGGKDMTTSDVERGQQRDEHAKRLHSRLLKYLYSVGLGQHHNSA
ncbi:DNA damage-inducible protein 1 [Penicillium hetheringtonii]|uniref:DNA damage-inducible protein 1 n=1 Tax=Penicillium hetheringtonii TaxID=911720 RepID=A0AAD6D9H5_9EURO|nr:DNA damage-inducible protein 1 [Penicillium hetheringtonii]